MPTRVRSDECANAEIMGVVLLIGIFSIAAGLLAVNVFSTPAPAHAPAAALEITNDSSSIRFAHLGGDPLDVHQLKMVVKRVDSADTSHVTERNGEELVDWFGDTLSTGEVVSRDRIADFGEQETDRGISVTLLWSGTGGETVINFWDPYGAFGPLNPAPQAGDATPGAPYVPRTQPPPVTPTTNWSSTYAVYANFTPDRVTVTPPGTVQFTDMSGPIANIDSWYWVFGDGSTSSERNPPPHPYSSGKNPLYYSVSLTVRNATTGASDTIVMKDCVHVSAAGDSSPVTFDVYPDHGNTPLTVQCTDRSTCNPTIWEWHVINDRTHQLVYHVDPYARNASYDPGTQHFMLNNTNGDSDLSYTIRLTVQSPYLSEPVYAERQVTVIPPLHANFTTNITSTGNMGIVPLAVQFTDTSAGRPEHWDWDFGDGTISTLQNPVHVFNQTGNFTVKLTVSDFARQATDSKTMVITVLPPVVADFTADVTEGVPPLTVTFTDRSRNDPAYWLWTFGDGTGSNLQNPPPHTYAAEGNYTVTLVAWNSLPSSGDSMVKVAYIHVGPPVDANFTANATAGVAPMAVQFNDTSTGGTLISWFWDFGDGTNSTEQHPLHVYDVPGTYSVGLTAANPYRNDTITKVGYITVMAPIQAVFGGSPKVVPVGDPVQFTDHSLGGPTVWQWDFGDGGVSSAQNPTHSFGANGTYTVSLTASHALDSDTLTRVSYITVIDSVAAAFNASPTQGNASLDVAFTDLSTGHPDAWSWEFGDNETSTVQSPGYTYTVPGNYTVNLIVWNSLRPDLTSEASATVAVYGVPTASFTADPENGTAPFWTSFTDTSSGNPTTWLWDFGDGQNTTARNPEHYFNTPGNFSVTLQVSNPAGTSTAIQEVTVW